MTVPSIREQFAQTMLQLGQADESLVVLVGDISHFLLQPFAKRCPGRYLNVGICEATIVSMAAGMAKMGFRPVIHTIAPFLVERAFEQIKLDFGYHRLGGNIVTVGSAFDYANLGCTHHCYGDFALLKTLPGTQIVYPGSPAEFDVLFRQSYRNSCMTYFRVPAHGHGQIFDEQDLSLGRGLRLCAGTNLTLVATGPQLKNALVARSLLQNDGWDSEVVYLHTIRPLDTELVLSSARKTKRVLVIEEHMRSGGLGDEILRVLSIETGIQIASLGIPDEFVRGYGSYEDHCRGLGLSAEGIVNRVRRQFGTPRRARSAKKVACL